MGDSKGDEEGEQAEGGRDGDLEERLPRGDGGLERGEWGMGDEHEQAADDRQRHHRRHARADRGHDRSLREVGQPLGDPARRPGDEFVSAAHGRVAPDGAAASFSPR